MCRLKPILAGCLLIASTLTPRVVMSQTPDWPYSKLVRNSDVIVVAKFVSQQPAGLEGLETDSFIRNHKKNLEARLSKLNVLATLKGQLTADKIEVLHLGWKPSVGFVGVNTRFIQFRRELLLPNVVTVEVNGKVIGYGVVGYGVEKEEEARTIEPEYLLFLRSCPDGKYIPVSRHRFAGLSTRIINK